MPFLHNNPISSIVIAGAGGFGLELLDYLEQETAQNGIPIAGFIDDNPSSVGILNIDTQHLGTINDFIPKPQQVVIVAIGSTKSRQVVLEKLWHHNIETPTYIHASAIISPTVKLGRATIVCPFSIINRNASIGDGAAINVHCSVGHGATIGTYSILSPYAALNGDASVGKNCFLGTRATIYPQIHIGNGCIVDSHTGVRAGAANHQMISSRGMYQVSNIRQ